MERRKSFLSWIENAKRMAALEAIKHVKDGFVIGLGSGSTVAYAIMELGNMIKRKEINVFGVPSSFQAMELAVKYGVPLTSLDEYPELDLTIDGADQVDSKLNLIKGGGAALTREKIIASASKELIIVVDARKISKKLGGKTTVLVEVLPCAKHPIIKKIEQLGYKPKLRYGSGKVGPLITDNGNFIVDIYVNEIENPKELELTLKIIPGIVEVGLFVDMADIVYVGHERSVECLRRK